MNGLDTGYSYDVDNITSRDWHECMLEFIDGSFYQTWSYGVIHFGERNSSHLVLNHDGKKVGMAQVRIAKAPLVPIGMAYVNWGPLWRINGKDDEIAHLRNILRALRNEYAIRRKYLLRIVPNIIDNAECKHIKQVFTDEGFTFSDNPAKTIFLDLSAPVNDLRNNLGRKWRQTLQAGERKHLVVLEGNDSQLGSMAFGIFSQMKRRKGFFGGDQSEAIAVNRSLPERLKLHYFVCIHDGRPIAALGCVSFGSYGLPLVSATSAEALSLNAGYVLWWKMIEYYKSLGFPILDMGGVNPNRNPGGYYFKTHILGKTFTRPDSYLGLFDACLNPISKMAFKGVYGLRDFYRKARRCAAGKKVQLRKFRRS